MAPRFPRSSLRPGLALLAILVLLAGCASTGSQAAPGEPAATKPRLRPELDSPRLLTRSFVEALNVPDPKAAGSKIDWVKHVARDPQLISMSQILRKRYAENPTSRSLDRPLFDDSVVTRRQFLEAREPEIILAEVTRERFERQVAKEFAHDTRATPAKLLAYHRDIRAINASIRMPNGRVTEFLVEFRAGRYWLVPLF